MNVITNVVQPAQEPLYLYFVERQENGQFDRYNDDMQTFINRIWNRDLGVTVAMSQSGIGASVTNGFVQFLCDGPVMQTRLINYLTEVRESFTRDDQPVIEVRTKSVPRNVNGDWSKDITHYITIMFRTPRFRNLNVAKEWWGKLTNNLHTHPKLM